MRLQIGRSEPGEGGVEAALVDCHARIRDFAALAVRLAAAADSPPQEIAQAATGVARYFGEALPRHEADEEESLRPRLAGRSPDVDAALADMTRQHRELHGPVAELVSLAARLSADPSVLADPAVAGRLGEVAAVVVAGFDVHLELEERVILPAIGTLLDDGERETIRAEIRSRRDS